MPFAITNTGTSVYGPGDENTQLGRLQKSHLRGKKHEIGIGEVHAHEQEIYEPPQLFIAVSMKGAANPLLVLKDLAKR